MKLTATERNVLVYAKCYVAIDATTATTRFRKAVKKLLGSGHLTGETCAAYITPAGRAALEQEGSRANER